MSAARRLAAACSTAGALGPARTFMACTKRPQALAASSAHFWRTAAGLPMGAPPGGPPAAEPGPAAALRAPPGGGMAGEGGAGGGGGDAPIGAGPPPAICGVTIPLNPDEFIAIGAAPYRQYAKSSASAGRLRTNAKILDKLPRVRRAGKRDCRRYKLLMDLCLMGGGNGPGKRERSRLVLHIPGS